ncbi:hypothetical protein ACIBI4_00445 [Streptomyces sp. NPDC050418]
MRTPEYLMAGADHPYWPIDVVSANARTIMFGSPEDIARIAATEGLGRP